MDLQLNNYNGVKRASPLLQRLLLTAYTSLHLYVQYLLQLNDMKSTVFACTCPT